MIAMQYSIVLPADYDMSIIDRRIAEKGHFMDGFPGLGFKAYLSARKSSHSPPEADNLYAPFYLWRAQSGLNDFLCGPGFAGLVQSFGRPVVDTWSVWAADVSASVAEARFATRDRIFIARGASLEELRKAETERAKDLATRPRVLASVTGFDPATWTIVRFQLWRDAPALAQHEQTLLYTVGHVSTASTGF